MSSSIPFLLRAPKNTKGNFVAATGYAAGAIVMAVMVLYRFAYAVPFTVSALVIAACYGIAAMWFKLQKVRQLYPEHTDAAYFGMHVVTTITVLFLWALILIGFSLHQANIVLKMPFSK